MPDIKSRAKIPLLTYPISAVWLTGCAVAIGITQDWWDLPVGLVLLSSMSLLIFMVSLRAEVTVVHHLVNSQRDELLSRIDTLVSYLVAAGVALPPGETEEPTPETEGTPHE